MGKLKVIKAGPITTIQDEGRFGFRRYGIPQSGAMDRKAMRQGNHLVGNEVQFPVIEHSLTPLSLEVLEESTITITGAKVSIRINGRVAEEYSCLNVSKGEKIELSPPIEGNYVYISIKGQLDSAPIFGSHSTYLPAAIGGLQGLALVHGTEIKTKEQGSTEVKGFVHEMEVPKFSPTQTIRYLPGPEKDLLQDSMDGVPFQVAPSSNRIGIRLLGQQLQARLHEIPSSAVIPGTIQLPPSGEPIILMNDCQTTGGYPRIGKVIDADLGRLAQVRPGQQLVFRGIDITVAIKMTMR